MSIHQKMLLNALCLVIVASGLSVAVTSCSTDGPGSIVSRERSAVVDESDLSGPPRWAEPGSRSRSDGRHVASTIDPRLRLFREQTPVRYGSPATARLSRFLFLHQEDSKRSVEERVAEDFSLPASAARLVTRGAFAQASAWQAAVGSDEPNDLYAEPEQAYWDAIEIAPRAWVAYEALGEIYAEGPSGCDATGIERIVDRWGDRRDAMLQLAPIVLDEDGCEGVLRRWVREFPDDLEVLGLLARRFDSNWHDASFGIAIRSRALELAEGPAVPAALRTSIRRGLIHALFSAGRAKEGIARWEASSDDERARMIEGPTDFESVFPAGFRGIVAPIDQALVRELIAAYWVNGEDARARAWMRALSASAERTDDHLFFGESAPRACDRMLRAALGSLPNDSFEFLLELTGAAVRLGDRSETCNHNETWRELGRRLARQAGYPELAVSFESSLRSPFARSSFEAFEKADSGLLREASPPLREHYERVRREFEVQDEPETRTELSEETRRLVDRRFESVFIEGRSSDAAPSEPLSVATAHWLEASALHEVDLPNDVVRIDRRGNIAVRVHLNQDVDPMGEVGAGGYWLSFSRDGGERWTRRFYTGLRANFPYVVTESSEIPILSSDQARIAAEVHEIDPSTISFPPIGLASKRDETGLLLTIPLERLTRDGDGDGLTDLLEAALLLSPDDADTDGDAMPDGSDPLPRTPFVGGSDSARAEALVAALPRLFGAGLHANVVPLFAPSGNERLDIERAMGSAVSHGLEQTLFIVGVPEDFSQIGADRRVIVLSRAEDQALDQRIGVFYPMSIGLFVLDHEKRRGYLGWGGGWTGGALGLTRSLGRWKVRVLSHWMT